MSLPRRAAVWAVLIVPAVAVADPPPGWKMKHPDKGKWAVGGASVDPKATNKLLVESEGSDVINVQPASDLISDAKYGDCTVEVEFLIPKGSNSGVYLMGEYEVQILDSYGREKVGPGDLGGLYNTAAPRVNAARKPGEWQKFVIDFRAPRFADGKRVSKARFLKVTLNGQVIHENVEMNGPTTSALTGKEAPTGPLLFQGDHGPVAFRNIRITPRATARE